MPAKSKKKSGRKAKTEYQKAHGHELSMGGRRVASEYQRKNTPYTPRVSRSFHKTSNTYVTHVSVMSGMRYGKRSGQDAQGRSYASTYRGKKAGWVGDIGRGEY